MENESFDPHVIDMDYSITLLYIKLFTTNYTS